MTKNKRNQDRKFDEATYRLGKILVIVDGHKNTQYLLQFPAQARETAEIVASKQIN